MALQVIKRGSSYPAIKVIDEDSGDTISVYLTPRDWTIFTPDGPIHISRSKKD